MSWNQWRVHYNGVAGLGAACGERRYMDASRYAAKVTCLRCQAIIDKHNKAEQEKEVIDVTKLTFVEELEHYSRYTNETGQEVLLHHETHTVVKPVADFNLNDLWFQYQNYGEGRAIRASQRMKEFLGTYLPALVADPAEAAKVKFCGQCSNLHNNVDDGFIDINKTPVCATCRSAYYRKCTKCTTLSSNRRNTEDGGRVCERCIGEYANCRNCNVYYNPENSLVSHRHDGSDCCKAPEEMMQFTMRNDGMDPVVSDTVTRVTLPAGVLSAEGRQEIANYLLNKRYDTSDSETQRQWIGVGQNLAIIGDNWQTKEGNYPKRVSRYAYKNWGLKINADVMSEIGNIGARHTVSVDFDIEFSRLLDQTATEWGHAGSCWWQSYYHCRCAMKSNGGIGVRSVKVGRGKGKKEVLGRAWIYPLKKITEKAPLDTVSGWLVPTFNTETPDAFVVFNGYGNLTGYAAPRLIANMQGMTYRKVNMELVSTPKNSYINTGSGYIVAPEDIADKFTDGRLIISVKQHSDLFARESGKDPVLPQKTPVPKKKINDLANMIRGVQVQVNANNLAWIEAAPAVGMLDEVDFDA